MKTSIISGIILVICLCFLIITQSQNVEAEKSMRPSSIVKFHVYGCDDCSRLLYCIDAGDVNYPGSCEFSWDNCTTGNHTIFVSCPNGKSGQVQFTCIESGEIQIENVYVTNPGPQNPCQNF